MCLSTMGIGIGILEYTWCQHRLVFYIVTACDFYLCVFISSI